MNGGADEERVSFLTNPNNMDRFIPQVTASGSMRPFDADDMGRVLDFDGIEEPPADGSLKLCLGTGGKDGAAASFVSFHCCLRGGFLFYFDHDDVDEESGPFATYVNPPLGVVPLRKVMINFPPGGRRVFREHAQSLDRNGYELVILHTAEGEGDTGGIRPPAFLVAESLGQREKWAAALRPRAEVNKATLLRAGYKTTVRQQQQQQPQQQQQQQQAKSEAPGTSDGARAADKANAASGADDRAGFDVNSGFAPSNKGSAVDQKNLINEINKKNRRNAGVRKRENKTISQQVMDISDDAELATAVIEFGATDFNENQWMNMYFQSHNDFDAPIKCKQMEQWLTDMKRSLKDSVLEQYEYFVQASGEMTTMGREISALKALIETQAETLREMKEEDFTGVLKDMERERDVDNGDESAVFEPPRLNRRRRPDNNSSFVDDRSVASDASSFMGNGSRQLPMEMSEVGDEDDEAAVLSIPDWLDDIGEQLSAVVRECRYNDAIELYLKARNEINDIFEKHERPTAYRLKKSQLEDLQTTQATVDTMGKTISDRLQETLRRKNEALKQASKRERSEAHASAGMTGISPCALKDDALYLQLLVKIGRTQEAAEAYSTRRSMLLLETLHERPISGAGTVDLVIYAAQLSQSFFSCLASSVEGFLDLFLMSPTANGDKTEDMSLDDSSLRSHTSKNVSAGAFASVVLWCDGELSKFASAFGGTRILANLALSPPPRDRPRKPRVVGQSAEDSNGNKERNSAIEVAAQCIEQAFMYASDNLDTVGLPLTPRLAEYIRPRLKGCETEVSLLLDERWHQLTADWRSAGVPN